MIFFISYLYWSWGRGRARFSFEMWAVREHLHMITGSSRCAVHSLSLRFLLCERYWRILLLCLLLESDYLISTICYSVSVECAILGWVIFLFKQGEAFVPESIVRFGKRTEGRDGVVTITAEDERIKYQGLHHGSSYLEHLNFLSAIRAQGAYGPSVNLSDGLLSVAIGVAGQLSIEQGRFVTMEEVLGS